MRLSIALILAVLCAGFIGAVNYLPIVDGRAQHAPYRCPTYDEDLRVLFPDSMVPDARRAAKIADSVALAEGGERSLWRRLIVRDLTDRWEVRSGTLLNVRGGGYVMTVSKCDASVHLIEITQ